MKKRWKKSEKPWNVVENRTIFSSMFFFFNFDSDDHGGLRICRNDERSVLQTASRALNFIFISSIYFLSTDHFDYLIIYNPSTSFLLISVFVNKFAKLSQEKLYHFDSVGQYLRHLFFFLNKCPVLKVVKNKIF